MRALKKIAVKARGAYTPDLRAISLMRIGLSFVVIADLLIRMGDLEAHYTDGGVWPNHLVQGLGWNKGYWSLHALNGTISFQLALFLTHLAAAVCLAAGYRTRVATLIVWLLYISLHNRNIYILQAGDDLLRLCLFWGLFLPWGARYSVDAHFKNQTRRAPFWSGLAYLLLIASVYLFTVLLKTGDEWTSEGSAVYYALSLDQLRLAPVGDWLYHRAAVLKILSFMVYYTELLIALLILIPFRKGYLRWPAFLLIAALHTGIALNLYVGLFYIISIVTAIGLIPARIMNRIEAYVPALRPASGIQPETRPAKYRYGAPLCIFLACLCLLINLSTLPAFAFTPRKEFRFLANVLRLNQYWGMFSPTVLKSDGWFVYHGYDKEGRQWDLRLNSEPVDYRKPPHVVKMYHSDRWRKLAENMQRDNYTFLRPLYGSYILRKWNEQHPEKHLSSLYLYFMQKENLQDYRTTGVQKILYCVSYER